LFRSCGGYVDVFFTWRKRPFRTSSCELLRIIDALLEDGIKRVWAAAERKTASSAV
jgi:hypothetical protein